MTSLLSWYLLIFMMITFAENEQNGIDFDFELEISWAMQVPELGHEEKVWQRFVYKNLKKTIWIESAYHSLQINRPWRSCLKHE